MSDAEVFAQVARVCVVDDDPIFLAVIVRMLQPQFEVVIARTEISTNLLTGQRKTVEGLNAFERSGTARTRWQRLGTLAPVFLDQLDQAQLACEPPAAASPATPPAWCR